MSFTIVFLSPGVLEDQTPIFTSEEPNLVFLYSMTDGMEIAYQPRHVSKGHEVTSKLGPFRLARIDRQRRIQLKPFEAIIVEGLERYTRIEGYPQLSCFTLRRSDYATMRDSHITL